MNEVPRSDDETTRRRLGVCDREAEADEESGDCDNVSDVSATAEVGVFGNAAKVPLVGLTTEGMADTERAIESECS